MYMSSLVVVTHKLKPQLSTCNTFVFTNIPVQTIINIILVVVVVVVVVVGVVVSL